MLDAWVDFTFWYYVAAGVALIALATLVAWYFSVLRPVAGAVTAAVLAFLVGFLRGEKDQKKRDSANQQRIDWLWWLKGPHK